MSSLPPSTTEVAALGTAVAAGVAQLTPGGGIAWAAHTVTTGLGVRPKAMVCTILPPTLSGIPAIIAVKKNSIGDLVTFEPVVYAYTADGSLASAWGNLDFSWVAIA